MAKAEQSQRAGRMAEAAAIYRRIVEQYPGADAAWSALALLALNSGDAASAADYMEKAVAINQGNPIYWRNLCELRRRRGDLAGSVMAGRKACLLAPGDAEAMYNLSLALGDQGEADQAIALLRKLLDVDPSHNRGWNNLGHFLMARGALSEAGQAFERAIGFDASNAEAHHNLALVAFRQGNLDAAAKYFDRAVALSPGFAEFGQKDLRRLKAEQSAAPVPQTDDYRAPGLKFWAEGRFEEAVAYYQGLLPAHGNDLALLASYVTSLADAGRPAEAVEIARRALAIDPDCASVRLVLGSSQLELGQWEEGWRNYEARFLGAHELQTGQVSFANIPLPQWRGEDRGENASILVVVEQGFGDTIQFCRFIPLLRQRFSRIALLVSPPLARLMDWTFGEDVAIFTSYPSDYSSWDCHIMLMSLPLALGTRLETLPATQAYLKIPSSARKSWRVRLDKAAAHKLRIGLSWTGRPEHRFNVARSIPLDQCQRLLSVEGVTWVSLQKRAKGDAAPSAPDDVDWIDWTGELSDFAVTAALIANLDLVIGIDSVNVHLAGALGVPVWLANRRNSEWRWMAPREDSPWYPTLRIFRQSELGDWSGVIDDVMTELSRLKARAVSNEDAE